MKIIENYAVSFAKNTTVKLLLVVGIAVLLWATGAPLFLNYAHARAANLSNISDTLTNSNNGSFSGHTIVYTDATSTTGGQTITVTLDQDNHWFTEVGDPATSTHFSLSYLNGTTTPVAIVASCTTGPQTTLTATGNTGNLTFALCPSVYIPGGSTITIAMATTAQVFINPATTSSPRILVGGTQLNSGETRVAILPNVTLTAAIATTFTFTVSGMATGTVINGTSLATTTGTSATSSLPFGTLVAGQSYILGQTLNVTTNARNGFAVTVQENQPPTSGAGAYINLFANGATTTYPISWVAPTGILNQINTYSHFGITSDDALEGATSTFEFAGPNSVYVGNIIQPRTVFAWNGPADGVTQNYGVAHVGYRMQITPLQPAGNDYTNTITYVATPTF